MQTPLISASSQIITFFYELSHAFEYDNYFVYVFYVIVMKLPIMSGDAIYTYMSYRFKILWCIFTFWTHPLFIISSLQKLPNICNLFWKSKFDFYKSLNIHCTNTFFNFYSRFITTNLFVRIKKQRSTLIFRTILEN